MGCVSIEYEHLENPQEILDMIKKHYNDFDWAWAEADWEKNFQATQKVWKDLMHENSDYWFLRLWTVLDEGHEWMLCAFYWEERMNSYIDICFWEWEWIEHIFDFGCPYDVLAVLNELMWRAKEVQTFYQIKVA